MIVAPKDYKLVAIDLSQAETWVVAHLANEARMKYELMHGDIHAATARAIYHLPPEARKGYLMSDGQRYIGKKSNHANSYRQGPYMYVVAVNKESDQPPFVTITNAEGKEHHRIWHETYNVKNWWQEIEESLRYNHFLITPYGRKRYFYGPLSEETYREATAFVPQSTIADHMFGCVQKELGIAGGLLGVYRNVVVNSNGRIRITNTSHDSAILEIPNDQVEDTIPRLVREIRRPMVVNGEEFTIPCDVEVGERWGELEKIKVA